MDRNTPINKELAKHLAPLTTLVSNLATAITNLADTKETNPPPAVQENQASATNVAHTPVFAVDKDLINLSMKSRLALYSAVT